MRAKTGVTREEALRAAEACSRLLREQFGAREVYVCGSAAGEAPWHDRSDLDLVVEGLPAGLHSHTDLLRQVKRPWGEKRAAVLDHGLALRLHRYMRFRHLFRHTYGYERVWEELRPLVEGLPAILADLNARLQPFLVPESG